MNLFLTIGIDPVEYEIILMGIGFTEEDSKKTAAEALVKYENVVHYKTFDMSAKGVAASVFNWFRSKGFATTDAKDSVRAIGQSIKEVIR